MGKVQTKQKFSLKGNSDNENSNIGEKDVEAIQSIAQKSIYDFSDEDIEKNEKNSGKILFRNERKVTIF